MKHTPAALLLTAALTAGCHDRREPPAEPPGYDAIAPLLARACAPCHGASAEGTRLDDAYTVRGCTPGGAVLVEPPDARAPLYAALDRADHQGLLDAAERARLLAWLRAGAPGARGRVHPPGILDPRSDDWHGALAAHDHYAPLRAAEAPLACGRCHDGSPVRPTAVQRALPDAPACTRCHDAPAGVLACATCHGREGRPYPPRDDCFFPGGATGGLHAQHLEPLKVRATPLACADCHPALPPGVLGATHANGQVDVAFRAAIAGAEARYDAATGACTVACHARGGSHATPQWNAAAALDCGSCHQTPPPGHYEGACARCHREMGALPTSLSPGPLHLDGKVELGLAPGDCGTCHGAGGDAWPDDAVHRAHRDTLVTTPIACDTCHEVPSTTTTPQHPNGRTEVRLGGRALSATTPARYDEASRSCVAVACHGEGLRAPSALPRWEPRETASCGACHGAPPPPPHVQLPTCGSSRCHGAEVGGVAPDLEIAQPGQVRHIDGHLQIGE